LLTLKQYPAIIVTMHSLELNKSLIISKRRNGSSCSQLAQEFDVSYIQMWNFLKRCKMPFRKVKLSKETEAQLVADYQSGKASKELGLKYGLAQASVCNYMRRLGVNPHGHYRAKTINHTFFKTLNEEVCWILGWFFTDGNVSRSSHRFNIGVQLQDKEVLLKIGKLMGSDTDSLYYPKNSPNFVSFFGCDKSIHSDLVSLGCVPNKSLVLQYPSALKEDHQHWAFLRGVLEGDGSIGFKSKANRPGFNCEISSGSKDFLTSIQSILRSRLNIVTKIKQRTKDENAYSASYRLVFMGGREPVMRFLDAVYKNGTAQHYLRRKFAIYQRMKEVALREPDYGHVNDAKKVEGYFVSPQGVVHHVRGLKGFSRETGVSIGALCNMLKPRKYRFTSRKFGWSPASPGQITAAHAAGTLIEKSY